MRPLSSRSVIAGDVLAGEQPTMPEGMKTFFATEMVTSEDAAPVTAG